MNIPKYINLFRKDLSFKNYSENTIKNYSKQVELFLKRFDGEYAEPSKINSEQIKNWLLKADSINTRKHRLSSLKLFYKFTVKQPKKFLNIEYPKPQRKLPRVIDNQLLKDKILNIKNLKHKAILMLTYSVGLRVSEVVNLKIEDIDSNKMLVYMNYPPTAEPMG